MCIGDNLSGDEDGKEMSPASVRGDPREDFFRRGDEDGELFPIGEFPITIIGPRWSAIQRLQTTSKATNMQTSMTQSRTVRDNDI
jgi:hypothetical protein